MDTHASNDPIVYSTHIFISSATFTSASSFLRCHLSPHRPCTHAWKTYNRVTPCLSCRSTTTPASHRCSQTYGFYTSNWSFDAQSNPCYSWSISFTHRLIFLCCFSFSLFFFLGRSLAPLVATLFSCFWRFHPSVYYFHLWFYVFHHSVFFLLFDCALW